jgi:sugar/nucleoside kinase (ribokinase family)
MLERFDALVAGHVCLDIIPDLTAARARPDELFLPGRLVQVGRAALCSGGPVSNTGLALHRLGVRVRLLAKTGDDLFGRALRQAVEAYGAGLADGLAADARADTSYTVIMSPPGVDRIFFHCPGANDEFRAADVGDAELASARLFHFGYPPVMRRMYEEGGRELAGMFRRAKAAGVTTSLDLTFPDPASAAGRADWRAILTAVLPDVDVFMPSFEEILFMLRRETYEELSRQAAANGLLAAVGSGLVSDVGTEILGLGPRIVGLKLGVYGLYLRTAGRAAFASFGRVALSDARSWAGRELWAPSFLVHEAGTTGAGDATIAGFLAALCKGLGPEEAANMATAAGACCVEAADALSGIRSWNATRERIAAGWKRIELSLPSPPWRFNGRCGLWESARS